MFSCEYCEIFKNAYFEEHLRTAASEEGLQGEAKHCLLLCTYTLKLISHCQATGSDSLRLKTDILK